MATTVGCPCGAVRYRAVSLLDNSHICHCRMCQKAVGGLFAALVAAPDSDLVFTRGTPATFRSSEHVERGICAGCGTPLFFRAAGAGRTNLTIGSLDRPNDFPVKVQVGVEARVSWWNKLIKGVPEETTTEGVGEAASEAIAASSRQHPDHDTDHRRRHSGTS